MAVPNAPRTLLSAPYNRLTAPAEYMKTYFQKEFSAVQRSLAALPSITTLGNGVFNVLNPEFGGLPAGGAVLDYSTPTQNASIAAAAAGGGTVLLPLGRINLGDVTFAGSHVRIAGCGRGTEVKKLSGATYLISANPGATGSPDPANNLVGCALSDMTLIGNSASGFNEHFHAVNLNGTTDFIGERLYIREYEGDAIYVGSGNVNPFETHNVNVTLRDIVLDGVNYLNRNGITFVDCDGFLGQNIHITRSGVGGEPGGVDLEPDATLVAFVVLRNIRFENLTVSDCPNVAGIAMNLPRQSDLATPIQNITFDGFFITGTALGWGVNISGSADAEEANPTFLTLLNGWVADVHVPLFYDGVNGLTAWNVHYIQCTYAGLLGYLDGRKSRNVQHLHCTVYQCATTQTYAWEIRSFDGMVIDHCQFTDNGRQPVSAGNALRFMNGLGGNTGARLTHTWNIYESPNGFTTSAIVIEAGYTLNNGSCRDEFNDCTVPNYGLVANGSTVVAPPVGGTWQAGSTLTNAAPASGGYIGYAYDVGTASWKSYGLIT